MGKCRMYGGDIFLTKAPIICHQVNCLGVMGAGLALQVKTKYPSVFKVYEGCCHSFQDTPEKLMGQAVFVDAEEMPGRFIANLFAQKGIRQGPSDTEVYTDYNALRSAMKQVEEIAKAYNVTSVAVPYMMGCGLAGGSWDEVKKILKEIFETSPVDLEIWRLMPTPENIH